MWAAQIVHDYTSRLPPPGGLPASRLFFGAIHLLQLKNQCLWVIPRGGEFHLWLSGLLDASNCWAWHGEAFIVENLLRQVDFAGEFMLAAGANRVAASRLHRGKKQASQRRIAGWAGCPSQ